MNLIDRRLNPGGKSLENRQRFLRRARALVKQAVQNQSKDRSLKDFDQGGEVSISVDSLREPRLHRASSGGVREGLLPGNKKYLQGDRIPKEKQGSGSGSEGSDGSKGEDDFRFALSQDEYLDLFFEDLELPDLAKTTLAKTESFSLTRAGYSTSGSPANLSVNRTMRNSMSRRIALRRPSVDRIETLQAEIDALEKNGATFAELEALRTHLELLTKRSKRVPFIDPIDIRYRRFQPVPKPVSQAVMFCLMDTSASMTEHMKDVAKRFFALLYIFLKRRYRHVDIVFIRHTHEAEEVDEDTFFHSPETGGTLVSSALDEMMRVVRSRYPREDWNIYAAQASDGDNSSRDGERTLHLMRQAILPISQYFAYLEVGSEHERASVGFLSRASDLWRTYETLKDEHANFAMRRVSHRNEIYPVFRDLFERKQPGAASAPAKESA